MGPLRTSWGLGEVSVDEKWDYREGLALIMPKSIKTNAAMMIPSSIHSYQQLPSAFIFWLCGDPRNLPDPPLAKALPAHGCLAHTTNLFSTSHIHSRLDFTRSLQPSTSYCCASIEIGALSLSVPSTIESASCDKRTGREGSKNSTGFKNSYFTRNQVPPNPQK